MSIRWRLPLSHAGIALLAALSLGAVLLLTLRSYYTQRELDYLTRNATAISASIGSLAAQGELPAGVLQAQVDSLSFLSQARVRLLDAQGQAVADSGAFEARSLVSVAFQPAAVSVSGVIATPLDPATAKQGGTIIVVSGSAAGSPELFGQSITSPAVGSEQVTGLTPPGLLFALPAVGTPYGFGLSIEGAPPEGRRSIRVVRQPFYDAGASLEGYVELSEGPAYGQQIVASVARAWAWASAVAVVLAALVGWVASRRISAPLLALTQVTATMAEGDLSVRADVARLDEFGALARSYNLMAQRVESTVTALRQLVSDAAHELRTPLATLRTNLEMVRQDAPPGQGERLVRAQAQVDRLEALTAGLLSLSRIESGTNHEALRAVSLTALVQEVAEMAASQAEQAGLAFDLVLPEEPLSVRGNPAQLRQALTNLVDNALKFTPEGGRVLVGLRQDGGTAELWVEDTGIGIPAQDLPHLFRRFHRGRNTAEYPGSGLGLAIVKAIADRHGGCVGVEQIGQRARFSLRLPLDLPTRQVGFQGHDVRGHDVEACDPPDL